MQSKSSRRGPLSQERRGPPIGHRSVLRPPWRFKRFDYDAARGPNGEKIFLSHDMRGRVTERRIERDGFRPKT